MWSRRQDVEACSVDVQPARFGMQAQRPHFVAKLHKHTTRRRQPGGRGLTLSPCSPSPLPPCTGRPMSLATMWRRSCSHQEDS
jgi:hypothetical protein